MKYYILIFLCLAFATEYQAEYVKRSLYNDDKQSKVVEFCNNHLGSSDWSYDVSRTSEDGKITFDKEVWKCNLFVYEALVSAGVDVPIYNKNGKNYPPNSKEWYNGDVDGFTYVGEGLEALDNSWPGDIIVLYTSYFFDLIKTDHHVGIITGPSKTCSAAQDSIIENDWGWRTSQWRKVRIYRYHP